MRALVFCVVLAAPSLASAEEQWAFAGSIGLTGGVVVQGPGTRQTGGALLGATGEGWRRAWTARVFGVDVSPAARAELGFYGMNGGADWLGVRGGLSLGLVGRLGDRWSLGMFAGGVGYRAPLCFGEGRLANYCLQTNGIAPSFGITLAARGGAGAVAVDAGIDWLLGNPVWAGPSGRLGMRFGF